MLPSERRDVSEKLVGNDFAARAQLFDGAAEIDGVPKDDGGDGEIEARGAIALVFEGPIADFAEAVEEHGAGEGVARFALVETGIGPPAQDRVAEREQSALQAANFLERLGERVLSRIGGKTAPVGSFPANPYGLYDMVGNVWEWTEDCWNESYHGAPADGSAWTSGDCSRRVVRGGSWAYDPDFLRSAYRGRYASGSRVNILGFRVARTLTP